MLWKEYPCEGEREAQLGGTRRHSRETEDLQSVPVVYSIQSHSQLEYAAKVLVITLEVGERNVDILCKDENPEVNVHLPGCRCRGAT